MNFVPRIMYDDEHYTLGMAFSREDGYVIKYGYAVQKTLTDKFPTSLNEALRVIRRKTHSQD